MNQEESEAGDGGGRRESNSLRGFYSYKNTFDEDSVWLDIPKNGLSSHLAPGRYMGMERC